MDQAVLDGRIVVTGPRQRNHPDFPLRGFVRCDTCGKPLTGSWSKGRNYLAPSESADENVVMRDWSTSKNTR